MIKNSKRDINNLLFVFRKEPDVIKKINKEYRRKNYKFKLFPKNNIKIFK